jgi:hypothetical protein
MPSLSCVVILGISIPLELVLNSRIDDGSGVIKLLLIPIDCAAITLLFKITISKITIEGEKEIKLTFKKLIILNLNKDILFFIYLGYYRQKK